MSLLSQASLVVVPSGYKEDVVYSVKPTDGSGDLTFTRASDGTRLNSQGLVERVPWNLVQQSETIGVSPWQSYSQGTGVLPVITANDTTAPNGTNTADKVVFDTGAGTTASDISTVYQTLSSQAEGVFTASIYAKVASGTAKIILRHAGGGNYTTLNLTTEWQRFEVTETLVGSSSFSFEIGLRRGLSNEPLTSPVTCYLWGAQVNIGSTAKPYFPTTDRLNVPRLTYQNGGGGCPSLLLEKQSTNYAIYSQDLTQSATSLSGGTVGANVTTSPDGTQNADSFTVNTATSSHAGYYETYNATNGQPFTTSIFLKAGTGRYFLFRAMTDTYSTRFGATIDLQSGTILSTNTSGSATGTASKIENFGNGWYRVSLTINAIGSQMSYVWGASNTATPSLDANLDYSYTGNGTDSYYLWGMTLENSSYPTSYIPTTSASVTRVADAASKTGISSLIGQTEGTIFLDINHRYLASYPNEYLVNLKDGTNQIWLRKESGGSNLTARLVVGGTNIWTISVNAIDGRNKIALVYKSTDSVVYLNGSQVSTSSSSYSGLTLADFYFNAVGSANPETKINQAVLFKTRLTNAELAALTTL